MYRKLLVVALLAAGAHAAWATLAYDVASNATYNAGWTNGSTGGTGFEPWELSAGGSSGFFIGTSANNGDGGGNIDTGGEAFGLYASNNETASAVRPFTVSMAEGDIFTIGFDSGWVINGGTVGFALQNASDQNLMEFLLIGPDSTATYDINRSGGLLDTAIPWTDDGLVVRMRLTSTNTFDLRVTPSGGGSSSNYTGNALLTPGVGDQTIAQLRVFNFNAGNVSGNDLFVNSLSLMIPEPGTLGLLGLGALAALRRRWMR